jgi:uncharacterized protein
MQPKQPRKKRSTKRKKLKHPTVEVRAGQRETRSYKSTGLSVRKAADGSMQLVGTAIVFGSLSQDLGNFREIVTYESVQRLLQRNNDVFMLWQHDRAQPLSRTTTGTLTLTLNQAGLDFVATLPTSPLGQNAYQAVSDGTVDSVSFGFTVEINGDRWMQDATGNIVRELLDINVAEISPVTWAAYDAPHVDVRSCPVSLRNKLKRDDDSDLDDDNNDCNNSDDADEDSDDCDEDRDECDCECDACEGGN